MSTRTDVSPERTMTEFPDEPDEYGRRVRVSFDLQDEFALARPFLEALPGLMGLINYRKLHAGAREVMAMIVDKFMLEFASQLTAKKVSNKLKNIYIKILQLHDWANVGMALFMKYIFHR